MKVEVWYLTLYFSAIIVIAKLHFRLVFKISTTYTYMFDGN